MVKLTALHLAALLLTTVPGSALAQTRDAVVTKDVVAVVTKEAESASDKMLKTTVVSKEDSSSSSGSTMMVTKIAAPEILLEEKEPFPQMCYGAEAKNALAMMGGLLGEDVMIPLFEKHMHETMHETMPSVRPVYEEDESSSSGHNEAMEKCVLPCVSMQKLEIGGEKVCAELAACDALKQCGSLEVVARMKEWMEMGCAVTEIIEVTAEPLPPSASGSASGSSVSSGMTSASGSSEEMEECVLACTTKENFDKGGEPLCTDLSQCKALKECEYKEVIERMQEFMRMGCELETTESVSAAQVRPSEPAPEREPMTMDQAQEMFWSMYGGEPGQPFMADTFFNVLDMVTGTLGEVEQDTAITMMKTLGVAVDCEWPAVTASMTLAGVSEWGAEEEKVLMGALSMTLYTDINMIEVVSASPMVSKRRRVLLTAGYIVEVKFSSMSAFEAGHLAASLQSLNDKPEVLLGHMQELGMEEVTGLGVEVSADPTIKEAYCTQYFNGQMCQVRTWEESVSDAMCADFVSEKRHRSSRRMLIYVADEECPEPKDCETLQGYLTKGCMSGCTQELDISNLNVYWAAMGCAEELGIEKVDSTMVWQYRTMIEESMPMPTGGVGMDDGARDDGEMDRSAADDGGEKDDGQGASSMKKTNTADQEADEDAASPTTPTPAASSPTSVAAKNEPEESGSLKVQMTVGVMMMLAAVHVVV
mmetsp:Transcript_22918/g.27696  ORF Transcript_22918/g.27696 Transcript_22918/m.27696 type:complete len:705 (+) Transcript_22918:175-2289(+)|eukprot:CAMPEP_0197850178 /NCGR_PEP_ID=MMETSP1438-20131217/14515_1 /TAXON_ID=1461541 /ORGANISM="Pterosperma sp., Strain CCMP1384" /LENGTH=704 /DNA_ID=CAMNT_0043463191 /DNA_START=175 /DNA_END=2289 /DNA_ORIENTATION=+